MGHRLVLPVRVGVRTDGRSLLRVELTVEDGDRPRVSDRVSLARRSFHFDLPSVWRLEDTHPDLVAIALLLCVRPFAPERLHLPFAVSRRLAEAASTSLGIDVGPVDEQLEPRVPSDGRPGLAFSGGVDSVAALTVMPDATASVFLDRRHPIEEPARWSIYNPAAARAAVETLRDRGRQVVAVGTDLEHIRKPVGFPVDLANAAPLALLADLLGLDAVAWGTVAESSYRTGHLRFAEYYGRPAYTEWASLFAAVGLPILNVVAGVSEVGTSKLVLSEGYLGIAQSCIRGIPGRPCRNCWKCFRKSLLDAALTDRWPAYGELDELFRISEARYQLTKNPVKHENVLAWTVQRYGGDHPLMLLLRERLAATSLDLSHLEHWYVPASEPWPEKYRADVIARLDAKLGRMDEAGEERVRSWDLRPLLDESRDRRSTTFSELLDARALTRQPTTSLWAVEPEPTLQELRSRADEDAAQLDDLERRTAKMRDRRANIERSRSYRLAQRFAGRGTS